MKVPFLDLSLQHAALREPALAALAATYDANRFCLGKDVEDFERNFGAALGYPRVLGMNSGTSPLHVACMIAGFGPGDEVITSPFTFVASAWGISYVGAKPVFAEIEADTLNLDPARLEAAITPRTKGLIVVHLFGQPARSDEIMAVARRHRLFVIEDCAQAVGARYRGTPVGLIGDCGTFSFYPTKNLGGCGEGGAFVSRHEAVQTRARHIRVHGSDRRYHHDIVGGNFRMDGFQGALLNVKLPHLAGWTKRAAGDRRALSRQASSWRMSGCPRSRRLRRERLSPIHAAAPAPGRPARAPDPAGCRHRSDLSVAPASPEMLCGSGLSAPDRFRLPRRSARPASACRFFPN